MGTCIFEIEGSLQNFIVSGWDPMSLLLYILAAPCASQVPRSEIKPRSTAVKASRPNHWIAREFPAQGPHIFNFLRTKEHVYNIGGNFFQFSISDSNFYLGIPLSGFLCGEKIPFVYFLLKYITFFWYLTVRIFSSSVALPLLLFS